jgi:hypothetical protein
MPKICAICRRLYFPSERRHAEDFLPQKSRWLRPVSKPWNLGTKHQHATSRPVFPNLCETAAR